MLTSLFAIVLATSSALAARAGGTFTDCLHFSSPGAISDKFDLVTDQLGAALGF